MDISDPVVVEGMQNMQIHQSGRQIIFALRFLKIKVTTQFTTTYCLIGDVPKLCYVSGITQFDYVERWVVNDLKHTF